MKTTITSIFLIMMAMLFSSPESNAQWRGSMSLYPTDCRPESVPDTLEPIGVVHIARHGARYMTSGKPIVDLRNRIADYASVHPMSEAAEKFTAILDSIDSVTDNRWGMLSSVGSTEEQQIATIMSKEMGAALRSGAVEAWSTYVPRAIMSMYDFTYRLASLSPYLNIQTHEGPRQDSLLRFFDTDSVYVEYLKNGVWKKIYNEYEKEIVPERPALALLGPESGLSDKELRKMTMDMYNVLRSTSAMGLDINPNPYFTDEELEACWKVSNLKHYLQRTATSESDIPARAAMPLLERVIENVETVADLRQAVRGIFYFAHAETLMPLFSLMNLPGCNAPDVAIDEVWKSWRDSDIVPLGANLDVEVWLNSDGELLISTVLNGERIPTLPGGELLTPWRDVKIYWEKRLN